MSWSTILLFIPACFALNLAFGPNNLLSLTYGMQQGVRIAVLAAAGRLLAFAIMIVITALGVGAVLAASEMVFTGLKWAGAAYLVWLGIKILRATGKVSAPAAQAPHRTLGSLAQQEFWTAIGNPKAILIFTAFFPQFIEPGAYWTSFALIGFIFLFLEVFAVLFYALLGHRVGTFSRNRNVFGWLNRFSGATMIGFGIALLFTRRPA